MSEHDIDPVIEDYVHQVANRFGAPGLEDLIRLASSELEDARAALEKLADEPS